MPRGNALAQGAGSPITMLSRGERVRSLASEWGIVLVIVALGALFGLTAPRFLLTENIVTIFKQISVVAIMAIGMFVVILVGGIDLSVGSSALLSAVVTMFLLNHGYLPTSLAILAGIAAACAIGLVNGFLVESAGISPIIVTLGTMIAVRGLAQTILWIDNAWLWVRDPAFTFIAQKNILYIPALVIFTVLLYIVFAVVLRQTSFGRFLYAIGGNARATALCGVPVVRLKTIAYVLSGFTAGIGGLVLAARLSAVSPGVGNNIQFDVILAVVLGGASLTGGSGRLEKSMLGALIAGMILNYLTIKGIPGPYQTAVNGLLILAAVVIDRVSRGKAE
ncbi:MAG TPA: ABC transporter permease [Spirochaetia bacterium]|nr:ABC transporter permease [Spirochaetia bacterium]